MGPQNAYELNQPAGGMSPGGNRHTQIPSMRLYLDPNASVQGRGFWTGKYAPKGKASEYKEDPAEMAQVSAFQEKGAPHEVVRHFDGTPEDEEETIKSLATKLTSVQVFSLAKKAMEEGDIPAYRIFKDELETRAFRLKVRKAIAGMGYAAQVDSGGRSGGGPAGRGKDSMQANRDKRVFEAMHGAEETSTEDKDEASIPVPRAKATATKKAALQYKPPDRHYQEAVSRAAHDLAMQKRADQTGKNVQKPQGTPKPAGKPKPPRKVFKAIGTKPSEKKDRPQKKAKPNTTAKVGASRSGNKTYDYRNKVNPPGPKKSPAETPPKGSTPTGSPADAPTLEAQPGRLANILGIDVSRLQKLADAKPEHEFVAYFKQKGATFLGKHKVPDSYLSEVYHVLARNTVKSFTVNPKKLKKGTEERTFAEQMHVSRVNTLPKLATFLAKGYDLSPSQASEMARELFTSLKKEGALS